MKRKGFLRMAAAFLAMALCVTGFSVTALASGGEDTAEVTGGMEPDRSESAAAESDTEETGDMEEPAADEGAGSGTEAAISWSRSPPCLAAWGMYLLTAMVSGSRWTQTGVPRPGP